MGSQRPCRRGGARVEFHQLPRRSKDPRYRAMNEETRSELNVPLLYKGRIIGVLDLEHIIVLRLR